jgi:hypothetical protein
MKTNTKLTDWIIITSFGTYKVILEYNGSILHFFTKLASKEEKLNYNGIKIAESDGEYYMVNCSVDSTGIIDQTYRGRLKFDDLT